jgi:hypothetical protein
MTQVGNPSERWTTLVNSAVLGTDRARPPAAAGQRPWIVNEVDGDATIAFLDEAAALAVYELAGRSASPAKTPDVRRFQSEERVCSPEAGRHLDTILYGGKDSVLGEWCEAAAAAGLVAPPELIPPLLSRTRSTRESELRRLLLAVSGDRGVWLADINPDWRAPLASATSPEDLVELWESGERDERLAAFARLRQIEPAQANQLLAAAWESEPAAERVRLLSELANSLADEDEPWLENCLEDRSKQVRATAAELLAMISASALSKRMASRVAEWVQLKPASGMLRKKKATVEFTAPDEIDDASLRDSLEAKASGGLGAKASLLRRLVALTPLSEWAKDSHAPADWLVAADASDWTDALTQGWAEAAVRQGSTPWSEAILTGVCFKQANEKSGMNDDWRVKQIEPLIAALPHETAERLTRDVVADGGRHTPTRCAQAALVACNFPWGDELSDAAAEALGKRLTEMDVVYDQSVRHLLGVAATRMAAGLADPIARAWTAKQEHWSTNFAQVVHDAIDTLRLRRDMVAALRDNAVGIK